MNSTRMHAFAIKNEKAANGELFSTDFEPGNGVTGKMTVERTNLRTLVRSRQIEKKKIVLIFGRSA